MDTLNRVRKRAIFSPASDRRPPELGAAGQDSRINGLAVNPAMGPGALRRERREGAGAPSPGTGLTAGTTARPASPSPSPAAAPAPATFKMDPATRNGLLDSMPCDSGAVAAETSERARLRSSYIRQIQKGIRGLCERKI